MGNGSKKSKSNRDASCKLINGLRGVCKVLLTNLLDVH
jgi:hypothetical protein